MRKKIVLAIALFVVLSCALYFAAGCGNSSSGGHVNTLRGYAVIQKVTGNDPIDGVERGVNLLMNNTTNRTVPSGTYSVTLPNAQQVNLVQNTRSATVIEEYYFGSNETPVGQINDPFSQPSSVTPYERVSELPVGQETGNYTFHMPNHTATLTDNVEYPPVLTIQAPAPDTLFDQGEPIEVSWGALSNDYGYLVLAYVGDPASDNILVEWSNVDISGLDFRDPTTVQALLNTLPSGTTATIPNTVFSPAQTVVINVVAMNRNTFEYSTTPPYGFMLMHMSASETYAIINPLP